jgi:hypothetical protein
MRNLYQTTPTVAYRSPAVGDCVFCAIVAGRGARLLRPALRPAGVNLVHATGEAAWQSVLTSTST